MAGRPKKYTKKKIKEISDALTEYIESEDLPIISEFAYLHGITRPRLYELEKTDSSLAEIMEKIRAKKESQLEKLGLLGVINPSMAIFSLKQMGWRDKQEVEHSGNMTINIEADYGEDES